MRLFRFLLFPTLLIWTLILNLFHAGVFPKPKLSPPAQASAEWLDAEAMGIHHMILKGPPYERGLKAGQLTKDLLLEQEEVLNSQLEKWLPQRWMRQTAVLAAIAWFQGIDRFLSHEHLLEMYGTSKSAPPKYDYLVDAFTRQVAYHGLHEVGQMMVDQGFEAMGCTVVAAKRGKNWILGRNFDFEGGRIFDREKIIKWVFPERGNAFVSIIWAGMVGAVTGVNEKGVYISINAAGSQDFARVGNPSTLVLLEVLQSANTSAEAAEILRNAPMFITDIFVVNDRSGNLLVVEKSPKKFSTTTLTRNAVITNHLTSEAFKGDPTNEHRKNELTSVARFERGQKLVEKIQPGFDQQQAVHAVLAILRDKGTGADGRPLNLGHRRAIDALIATHSVVYDSPRDRLYVSQGPAISGPFLGYDLKQSFAKQSPVFAGELPRDPLVSDAIFERVKNSASVISRAHRLIAKFKCLDGMDLLESIPPADREQSAYYHALGDAQKCRHSKVEARLSWQRALALTPAYAKEERALRRSLAE